MPAVLLLVLAAVAAVGDWVAVWRRIRRVEIVLAPLTLALLIAAAATADLGDTKPWVLAALALGLAGDAALLVTPERWRAAPPKPAAAAPDRALLIGLSLFLLGHVAYLVAFAVHGVHPLETLAGALVAIGVGGLVLPAVLRAARTSGGTSFVAAVAAYAAVLAAMTALAAGTSSVLTAIGGVLFLASDALLAHDRFVRRLRFAPLLVIVSYHAAQGLILVGLIRSF